ncbi:hypothetical protein K503DRAFT_860792 [Rhizopogon vinicolor AM-OR11-026]|uniref:Uncharacterized protein n=1 Tax=Rhizopogon vinicolor AM-OR11-026 TaxID=1314800 RepID=A0A1B7MFD7_9AGAM|nr:hypothetical protein K503DRAFT_860792 [Rhizopogon vinicolor AM-OR11-026]
MSNISPALLSTSEASLGGQSLEIERTEGALISWLQKHAREILPEPLFITASVLFAWVDLHDLRAVLEASLNGVTAETQFHRETPTVFHLRGSRYLMEERMYRAQMELSLFSKAIVNLCEEMNTRCPVPSHLDPEVLTTKTVRYMRACQAPVPVSLHGFRPTVTVREKCNAWLLTLSHPQHAIQVSNCSGTLLDSQLTLAVPELREFLLSPEERRLSLPHFVKTWADNVAYRAYINASFAELDEPLGIDNYDNFKTKECRTLDVLKSDLQILYLKKQRAQAEVNMFCEAIERTSEFGSTDGGTTSGISTTYESRPPANDYRNDLFSDSCSTLSTSSDDSEL